MRKDNQLQAVLADHFVPSDEPSNGLIQFDDWDKDFCLFTNSTEFKFIDQNEGFFNSYPIIEKTNMNPMELDITPNTVQIQDVLKQEPNDVYSNVSQYYQQQQQPKSKQSNVIKSSKIPQSQSMITNDNDDDDKEDIDSSASFQDDEDEEDDFTEDDDDDDAVPQQKKQTLTNQRKKSSQKSQTNYSSDSDEIFEQVKEKKKPGRKPKILTDGERTQRKKARQEKNREAAKRCRNKKQQYFQDLEVEVLELRSAKAKLLSEVDKLKRQINTRVR